MSTNLKDAVTVIEDAVNENTEINAHCMARFGCVPAIYIGINPRKPPNFESKEPVIALWTGGRARAQNQAHLIHSISIGCGVKDEAQIRKGQSIRFKGLETIDDFANLVEKIITRALNANGYASTQEPANEDENIDSHFKAVWTYVVQCPSTL